MAYQSEAELEQRLISDLIDYKNYTRVSCPDESSIELNFRVQMSLLNQASLSIIPHSEYEFEGICQRTIANSLNKLDN